MGGAPARPGVGWGSWTLTLQPACPGPAQFPLLRQAWNLASLVVALAFCSASLFYPAKETFDPRVS